MQAAHRPFRHQHLNLPGPASPAESPRTRDCPPVRHAARPLLSLGEGRDWAGAAWSPAGKRLLGCPVGKGEGGRQLVWWERQQLDKDFKEHGAPEPCGLFELNSGREFFSSWNYGSMWSPWQEDVVISSANFSKSKNRSVLAVDIKS